MSQNWNSKLRTKNQFFWLRAIKWIPWVSQPKLATSINNTKNPQSRNYGQNLDLECGGVDSNITESIVNFVVVQLVDETTTRLFTSIGTFCFFVETISNEKKIEMASMNWCHV
jgi:hypothetical protein